MAGRKKPAPKQPPRGRKKQPGKALVPVVRQKGKMLVAVPITDPPKQRGPGRPRAYDAVDGLKAMEVVRIFADGFSIMRACRKANVRRQEFYDYLHTNVEVAKARDEARLTHFANRVDRMREIAMGEPDVQRARLLVHIEQWEAARVLPGIWGDRSKVEHDGTITHKVLGMTDLLQSLNGDADVGVGPARTRTN